VARQSVKTLFVFSIVPFSVVFFFGAELFALVFGEDWREAGQYAQIMAPWFMVNFMSSPISSLPLILKKQGSFFMLALVGSLLMIASLLLPNWLYGASIIQTLWITSLSQAAFLIVVIFIIFGYAKNWKK
jgi:O-antigen/teichoic acid export membrane protein